jgi:hypothetical protein
LSKAAPALIAAAFLAACGNPGGDLIAIEKRQGGAVTKLLVTDDGRGSCGGGELKRLESDRLLEAREVEREMEALPGERAAYAGLPGASSYRAVMRDATVTWVEGGKGVPPVIDKATALAYRLDRELCPHVAGVAP